MRVQVCCTLGTAFTGFDNCDLITECHLALRDLSTSEGDFLTLVSDFMSCSAESDELFETLKEWQPKII